jgi:type II secretory ATPase GspE/PulE/Tfp pilus assembly ATPase PilB-like protein
MVPDPAATLAQLDASSPLYATQVVDALLAAAVQAGASDVHLHPTPQGLSIRWRIDGVLQTLGEFERGQAADVVARLKVLAELLTYRNDVPQEGRIRTREHQPSSPAVLPTDCVEMRVSTFPTLHGERAVVRLFAAQDQYLYPQDLGLPPEVEAALARLLQETSGAILLCGPAGSGKTTTAYACLREIVRQSRDQRNIVTLEDPVEVALPGVSQSQVQPAAGFTLTTGLRSLMRQDPEVILVGEIRDAETVSTVFQAALTGHLVFSTFHAGSAPGAISRLLDMGIEPYLLTSGLRAVVHQRLVRRLCACAREAAADVADRTQGATAGLSSRGATSDAPSAIDTLPITSTRHPTGCSLCRHTGYRGRLALAELLPPLAGELGQAVLARRELAQLTRVAVVAGMKTIVEQARAAVAAGQTDAAEVRRVLGFLDETVAGP